MMQVEYLGVIDGIKTWIVKDESGKIIGKNETLEYLEEESVE
jgi:hypothetical protein